MLLYAYVRLCLLWDEMKESYKCSLFSSAMTGVAEGICYPSRAGLPGIPLSLIVLETYTNLTRAQSEMEELGFDLC